jgi:hypothetical protein
MDPAPFRTVTSQPRFTSDGLPELPFCRIVVKRFPAARTASRTCMALEIGDLVRVTGLVDGRVQFLRASDSLALEADARAFTGCTSPVQDS